MMLSEAMRSEGLAALEAQVALELARIEVPLRQWVPERRDGNGAVLDDVVIVGAGLSGLAVAFGLLRQGIHRIRLIDAAPEGREGPWITTARMRTLRSPKTLTGPDLGVPSLTYRAWHEAAYGPASWSQLDKIERGDWMAYLCWFRRVLRLRVDNLTRLTGIRMADDHLLLELDRDGTPGLLECRKVVLATGIEGAGGLRVPAIISDNLPREKWTHSGEALDLGQLRGRAVGVIGAAASSFDWAVAALEAGAESVTLLARACSMPRTEILDWSNFPGFLNHFADLDDRRRYAFARQLFSFKTPPTVEMYDRALAFPNCRLVMGAGIARVGMAGDRVELVTEGGDVHTFDHLLLGTGYVVDLAQRPEFAGILDNVARWADRFAPEPGEADPELLSYPYLGPAFEFTERVPGLIPRLCDIHIFNNGAVPSLGPVCNGITGLKSGVPRLVAGISRGLFEADIELHYASLAGYDKVHFQPATPLPEPALGTA